MSNSRWWQGGLLGGGAALILAGAGLLAGATGGTAAGQAGPAMRISPATQNVPMGTQFTVELKAENVSDLGAWEATVQFDTSKFEYVGWASGPFLQSTGRTQQCLGPFGAYPKTVVEATNENGAMRIGCNTTGDTPPGPSGEGTLATLTFKTKSSAGTGYISLRGWAGDPEYPFLIRAGDPESGLEDQKGVTGFGNTEGVSIDSNLVVHNAAVGVFDPNQPTPTAPPATPTQPKSVGTPTNIQATVAAAVGTPSRRLTDGSSRIGNEAGTGPGGRTGTTQGSGGVAGSGNTIGSDGVVRGPDGAPIAGSGPRQEEGSEWPQWAGIAFVAAGVLALGGGVAVRRRAEH
ncbi:MAG TPA: cohesin domain-containing protein [Dehalococcoidia bacterium]|nr:cohesin domain-containing protein [Dehalococcoidia bacterium]